MPITRFIADLDKLMDEFASEAPSPGIAYAQLRMAVARMNELQRQLDIAREKLGAILSLAEMKIIGYKKPLVDQDKPASHILTKDDIKVDWSNIQVQSFMEIVWAK